ncbi:MAG: hypothetical protein JXR70_03150 [Spirochaetales bacterium]|nr:hypothetical protein [Spirochaetales bacterium]
MADIPNKQTNLLFDQRLLRFFTGIIAIALPILTQLCSNCLLPSVSHSYHAGGRDIFVGLLFILSAFLMVYDGHKETMGKQKGILGIILRFKQSILSKLASIAAICVALSPVTPINTACETGISLDANSIIHYVSAVFLFCVLSYFCLGPFTQSAAQKKAQIRVGIYRICGYLMLGGIACLFANGLFQFLKIDFLAPYRIAFWAEALMLWAFGFAWFTASQILFAQHNRNFNPLEEILNEKLYNEQQKS